MRIRFFHVKILTMEKGRPIFDGELWVENERILYVGEGKASTEGIAFDRQIDGRGNLLMPGFKNAHTHSGMTLLRSLADDLPLFDWLNQQVFPVEEKLTEEDIYYLTKLAVLEYVTSGITAIFDMYLTPETIAQAVTECGLRCVQVGAVNNFSQSVKMMEEMYKKLNHLGPLSTYILGFHGEYTCKKGLLEDIAALAHQYKAPIFSHNSETLFEVEECKKRYGKTPTAFLDSLGMFDYGGGGYHCVYMTEEDICIFKERALSVVTNPSSNLKLASGIAPIKDFLREGINVAIGTDGPASNNCLDMFREMFLVTGLAKFREKDASAVDADQVLSMATLGGAKAMHIRESDVLAKGKLADMIMLDLHRPNMQPINNISKNIVYSGSKENVKMTMVHGKILYEKGDFFVGMDPEEIYRKVNDIKERIV